MISKRKRKDETFILPFLCLLAVQHRELFFTKMMAQRGKEYEFPQKQRPQNPEHQARKHVEGIVDKQENAGKGNQQRQHHGRGPGLFMEPA